LLLYVCDIRESFRDVIVWFDEATFKFNCAINRHSYVYWATEYSNVTQERAVNLSGTSVWCGMPSEWMLGSFFFEATVTGTAYLTMLKDDNILVLCINILFSDEDCYFQHDGSPPNYHTDVKNFLVVFFPGRRMWW
jgi:hypothetical protein